jgi:transcriptional regulator with XRE-family HTH domain
VHPFGELSARRQDLGATLRRLRKNAGLSGEEMAEALGISQSQVSRMELGQQVADPAVVENWGRVTGAPDIQGLLGAAEAAAAELVSWRRTMARGLARLQEDSRELEAGATAILNFQTAGVPGLLQVPEYARRVFAMERQASQADIAAAVAGRMNRQAILYEGSRRLEFVMTEAAARWRLGAASLMRAQIEKIITVASLENVTVGIIPQDTETDVWHDHGFNVLERQAEGDETVVHVETLTRGLTITDPADVAAYQDAFARLRKLAVTGEDAQALLRQIAWLAQSATAGSSPPRRAAADRPLVRRPLDRSP